MQPTDSVSAEKAPTESSVPNDPSHGTVEFFDVVVCGGGPAGSMTAAFIAGEGRSVLVIEEHAEIGRPVQCAGIVEPRLLGLVPFKPEILAEMHGAQFYCDGKECFSFSADSPKAVVIDRAVFDKQCASYAASQGAEIRVSTRLTDARREEAGIRVFVHDHTTGGSYTVRTRLLIGADGFASTTAALFDLPRPEKVLSAFEIEVTGLDDHPADRVSVYYDEQHTPGFFAWVIPSDSESIRHRIGLAVDTTSFPDAKRNGANGTVSKRRNGKDATGSNGTDANRKNEVVAKRTNGSGRRGTNGSQRGTVDSGIAHCTGGNENARRSLMMLLEQSRFDGIKPVSFHAGGIPVGLPDTFVADRVMLIGDAAGMVKPTSGGGINIALGAARMCADTALAALRSTNSGSDCNRQALRPFERAFLKRYGQELKKGHAIQKNFFYRSNREIKDLLSLFSRDDLRSIIVEKGDIDHPVRLAMALTRREPRLMRYLFGYARNRVF